MKISDLAPRPGSRKKEKRIGRGPGSGHGKTATKGHKGQAARSGGTKAPGFEGGQQPLIRRVPKVGFISPFKRRYALVHLSQLERFDQGQTVDIPCLIEAGLVKKSVQWVKVLSDGGITKPLIISAHRFSGGATKKIVAAGGEARVLSV